MQKQNSYPNDRYREQYAIIVKHLICSPSNISLYQLERFVMSKPYIMSYSSAGLQYIWNNFIQKKAVQIGSAIASSLGPIWIGGVGLASAIAIGGLLYAYDNKSTQTNESILSLAFANNKISQIQAYLRAYQSCFNSINKIQSYCKQIQSPSYLIQLQTKLNEILHIILTESQVMKLNKQLQLCGIFYKIAKIVIHLNCMISFDGLGQEISKLRKMHKQIKKVMNIRIQEKISINTYKQIYVTNVFGDRCYVSIDQHSILSLDQLSTEVYDVIFRCPITKLQIEQIFNPELWTKTSFTDISLSNTQNNKRQQIFLGKNYQQYNKTIQHESARIRFINFNYQQKEWAGFYELLKDKSGFHQADFKIGGQIEFDKMQVLFLSREYFKKQYFDKHLTLTCFKGINNHTILDIHKILSQSKLQFGPNMSFCAQFNQFSEIKTISSNGFFNIKFYLQPKTLTKQYGPFTGFIATLDKEYNIGFGVRGLLNWKNGYNFHSKGQTYKSQRLIFEAITAISFFYKQQSNQLSEFYCRITNEYDQTMYMCRENRDKNNGVFGNDTVGGEIIRIKLIQKMGKGQYKGNLSIITPYKQACIAYVSSSKGFEWSKNGRNDQSTIFYMRIKQE